MKINTTQLVAHRGYQHRFPENCLLSINAAIHLGAVNIEIDVQLNDEGRVILFHDIEMGRMTGEKGNIHTLASQQLSDYYCSEPDRLGDAFLFNPITLLADALPIIKGCPHVRFFIELKEESVERYGADVCLTMIRRIFSSYGVPSTMNNVVLISFSEGAIAAAKKYGFVQSGLVIRDWHNRNDLVEITQADWIFINCQRIDAEKEITANVPVVLYEIGSKALAIDYLSRGAYAVETFNVGELL
jgi:glycerophosphoryl diester phosphodiesterase